MEPSSTDTHSSIGARLRSLPRTYVAFGAGLVLALLLGYLYVTFFAVEVAAIVNGAKITQKEVDENVSVMMRSAEMQGLDVADPAITEEIKAQALQNLINNELLLSAARTEGVSANEAAIQSAYETLLSEVGGEEALQSRMESVGLTSDALMGNISDRIIVDAYIESATDIENISVTDEEMLAYLNSIQLEGVTLPSLEEIKPQLETTLLAQKQQMIIDELIAKLKSEATIVIR